MSFELKDGRTYEVYAAPQRIGREVIGRFWSYKDITQQKRYENGLLERNENIKSLFVDNLAIMLLLEPGSGRIVHANVSACRFYGYTEDAICKMSLSDLSTLPPGELSNRMRLAENKQKNFFSTIHRLADKETRDVQIFIAPINYKDRVLLFGIVQDITEANKTKRMLAESRTKARPILEVFLRGSLRSINTTRSHM